jgi:hybrid cluster-associated redox disulfide protein
MDSHSITPDWTIERILSEQPAAIPVLLAHRLACVGCYMTAFCTLEDAITIYRLPHEQLLEDLQLSTRIGRKTDADP